MADCLVNDIPEILDFRPETWGALLDGLDRRLGATRHVVTAVRFDGVDQPSFRDDGLLTTSLTGIARVDVESEDALTLLRQSVDAAADSLPALVTGVRLTAAALRSGAPDAAMQLSSLIVALQSLLTLTVAVASAADASLGVDAAADRVIAGACHTVETALQALVARQTDGDGAAIADALDDQLAPAVASWSDVLTPIRLRTAA